MYRFVGTIAVLLLGTLALRAGSVQTTSGRFEGKVVLHKDHVTVDDKKVAWDEVLYLVPDSVGKLLPRPQWIHLKNGETWAVQIVGLAEKELEVRSDLFGATKVDVEQVRAIDFARQRGREQSRKTETLYRAKGEPIPGKLLAIKADQVVVDSVVGMIDVPRDGLLGFQFTDEQPKWKPGEDEVALIDGSIFRGKLVPAADGFQLEHDLLERLTLPARIVRSVVRHPKGTSDLTELAPDSVETAPVLPSAKMVAAQLRLVRDVEEKSGRFIKGLAIEPKTVVRYKLPAGDGKKGRLSALLLPAAGSQGEAQLTIRQGENVLAEKKVAGNAKAEALALDVSAGEVLEIVVDFGDRPRFPCGIILGDPHVVWQTK